MSGVEACIREVSSPTELDDSLKVIQQSFQTVADQFGFTRENCPAHTAFLSIGELYEMKGRRLTLFGLFLKEQQVGFIAVENGEADVFWVEKLAVLPSHRHQGLGEKLVRHAIGFIGRNGGNMVRLGMIDEHKVLKDWYKCLGFVETSTRVFPHLPFTVCMMEKDLDPRRPRG
jgi:GNAT superfamily N-acetyltransferase